MEWDVFVSHADEDKEFVRDLAEALKKREIHVWFDEWTLKPGDSLRRKIDEGLRKSRYGVVVLSRAFFAKEWPRKELDALVAREEGREKVLLPVWHRVSVDEVRQFSVLLADRLAMKSEDQTIEEIVDRIKDALGEDTGTWSTARVRAVSSELPTLAILEDDTLRLEHDGLVVTLGQKSQKIVLGRAGSTDIQVTDRRSSRKHAFIQVHDGHFMLEDNESKNGTFVLMENEILVLRGEKISLIGKGKIGLGIDPNKDDSDLIDFERRHSH